MHERPVLRSPYRSRMDITADILKIAAPGAKKTRIMYGANLSYKLLNTYITRLTKEGLLALRDDSYHTITKGEMFLKNYQKPAQQEISMNIKRKLRDKPITSDFIETYRKLVKC